MGTNNGQISSSVFYNSKIERFTEFEYFTGITTWPRLTYASYDCGAFDRSTVKILYLPPNVSNTLSRRSLSGMTSLEYLKIGSSVTNLDRAFEYNSYAPQDKSLAHLILCANTVVACSNFSFPTTCKIYVPDSLVDDYKASSTWSSRSAYIYPMSELVEP